MEVKIVRSGRRTLLLTFDKSGSPVVRAPYGVPAAEIDLFVKKHSRWLSSRIAERESVSLPDLSDGNYLKLFGKSFLLANGRTRCGEGTLFLPAEGRESALIGCLKRMTAKYMGELTEALAARYGFSYAFVRVSSARGRWGSCSKRGTISYTFRIAFLPRELAEYIAVHELCHTKHFDHGPAFWKEVEQILPDWRVLRKLLKENSGLMRLL